MARLCSLSIENYRSIGNPVELLFPERVPLVLLGENNAGKSNIVRALDLLLGPMWPTNHDPEDHEFFDRDRTRTIRVTAEFDPDDALGGEFTSIFWHYKHGDDKPAYRVAPGHKGFPDQYPSNAARDSCVCIVVQAERNLSYHLSYTSKYTLLSRLMHRFHKALSDQPQTKEMLESLFGLVKAEFSEIAAFKEFTSALQSQLADLITSMTHQLQVDFEAYNPTNFFHALRLQASEEGHPRSLEEMGTGEQQILALSFAYAYARAFHEGIVLVIEEPESHLHPLAQEWLGRRIRDMAKEGLQVVLTTHSADFIDILGLDGLALVWKENGSTCVRQLDVPELVSHCISLCADEERCTAESILSFYDASATAEILAGFFAKAIVLVEGRTEQLALPVYLRRLGFEHTREGVAILAVLGKGNLAKWYRLFTAYAIPCYVIFDNDAENDEDGERRSDVLRTLAVPEEDRAELMATTDWLVRADFSVFGGDFEACLRSQIPGYQQHAASGRKQGAASKPLAARWAAEHVPLDDKAAGWRRLKDLKTAIEGLLREAEVTNPVCE